MSQKTQSAASHAAWTFAVIQAMGADNAERTELREAGVTSSTIDALYPLKPVDIAPGLLAHLQVISIDLSAIQQDVYTYLQAMQELLFLPPVALFGQKSDELKSFDEAEPAVQACTSYLLERCRDISLPDYMGYESLDVIWLAWWLMTHRNDLPQDSLSQLDEIVAWVGEHLLKLRAPEETLHG